MCSQFVVTDSVRHAALDKLWLGNCSEGLLCRLRQLSRVNTFAKGASILWAGEQPDYLYVILAGKVRVCVSLPCGKEVTVFTAREGEPIGLPSVVDQVPPRESAVAAGRVVALRMWWGDLDKALREEPKLWRSIAHWQGWMVRRLLGAVEELGSQDVRPRLAQLIALEAEPVSAGQPCQEKFVVRSSQQTLSRLLGVSRQTVSKHLRELEREGFLRIGRREVWVHDSAALRQPMGHGRGTKSGASAAVVTSV